MLSFFALLHSYRKRKYAIAIDKIKLCKVVKVQSCITELLLYSYSLPTEARSYMYVLARCKVFIGRILALDLHSTEQVQ